jgi:hypothetical protein
MQRADWQVVDQHNENPLRIPSSYQSSCQNLVMLNAVPTEEPVWERRCGGYSCSIPRTGFPNCELNEKSNRPPTKSRRVCL